MQQLFYNQYFPRHCSVFTALKKSSGHSSDTSSSSLGAGPQGQCIAKGGDRASQSKCQSVAMPHMTTFCIVTSPHSINKTDTGCRKASALHSQACQYVFQGLEVSELHLTEEMNSEKYYTSKQCTSVADFTPFHAPLSLVYSGISIRFCIIQFLG